MTARSPSLPGWSAGSVGCVEIVAQERQRSEREEQHRENPCADQRRGLRIDRVELQSNSRRGDDERKGCCLQEGDVCRLTIRRPHSRRLVPAATPASSRTDRKACVTPVRESADHVPNRDEAELLQHGGREDR